jgi:hypothetical protein
MMDLEALARLYERLGASGGFIDTLLSAADTPPVLDRLVCLRHDMDGNEAVLEQSLEMAKWEADRNLRSTYFVLHSEPYYREGEEIAPKVIDTLRRIESFGHDVGLHIDVFQSALRDGRRPEDVLAYELTTLRAHGFEVAGCAAHGSMWARACGLVGYEVFSEWDQGGLRTFTGEVDGMPCQVRLNPLPLAHFGLAYEAYRLPRTAYISDNGGQWNVDIEAFELPESGMTQILTHPCWWF